MDFKDIVMLRYATKQFDGRMIEEEKLFTLLDIIRYSPSAFNLRPHANDQPQITTCSHLLVFCANTELEPLVDKVLEGMEDTGMPNALVQQYAGMIKGYIGARTPDQRIGFAREQIYIGLANAINGAKSLGFDSCPMGGFDPVAFSEVLFLPEEYIPVVLCAIGYAADTRPPKWRLPREEVFF